MDGTDIARQRLCKVIEQRREEIEQRWLERVQRDVVKRPGVELTQLRDGMPDYLVALSNALRSESIVKSLGERGDSAWSKVARDHGITRVRIGFDISPGVSEAESLLTELLDSAISVAVQAYV